MAEFKLKDLTSLDLKNGDKIEAEVEGIENGKVLLVKVQGKIHALNPKCTHFGAPLKNGVLTSSGRLTCPWHGGMLTSPAATGTMSKTNLASLLQCRYWRLGRRTCSGLFAQVRRGRERWGCVRQR